MALHRELRDLLSKSYLRLNDLNGHIKRRDLEETLGQNAFKSKVKARNVIASLHQLLDAFYKYLLRTIDESVVDISKTLKQHSSEIEESATYTAQLCLIAEKFLKEDSGNEAEGILIKEKLMECLSDVDVLKTVDYKAFVSLDLDVDTDSLFAIPFIHVVSHKSDQSEITKLHSLSFEGLRQQACEDLQKDPVLGDISMSKNLKTSTSSSVTLTEASGTDLQTKNEAVTVSGSLSQNQSSTKHLSNSMQIGNCHSVDSVALESANDKEVLPRTSATFAENAVDWLEKHRKDQLIFPATSILQPSQEKPEISTCSKQDGASRHLRNETMSGSHDCMYESGYDESLSLLSQGRVQELPRLISGASQSLTPAEKHLLLNDTICYNFMLKKVQENLNLTSPTVPNSGNLNPGICSASPSNEISQYAGNTQNVVDRNLMILRSCFKNAQRQSWQLQSFPYRNA